MQHPAYRRSWSGFITALALPAVGAAYLAVRWNDIPDRFATHFNARGNPDGWSDKSIGSVFTVTIIMALSTLLIWGILWSLRDTQPQSYPPRTYGDAELRRHRAAMAGTVTYCGWFFAVLNALVVVVQIAVALPSWNPLLRYTFPLILLIALGGSALLIWGIARAASQAGRPQPGDEVAAGERERNEHVKWGMFYYNPADPRLFVEKQLGVGVDFNYAKWPAKVTAVGLLALTIGATAAALMG